MVNVFIGLSIGANVLVARYYGARDEKNLEETVHTAMVIAVVGGLLLIAVGELLTKPILILMGSPEDVLPLAVLYMKIYFLGMPGTLVYNFGIAILRAVGDTRRLNRDFAMWIKMLIFAPKTMANDCTDIDIVLRQINQRLRKLEKSDSEKNEEIGRLNRVINQKDASIYNRQVRALQLRLVLQ